MLRLAVERDSEGTFRLGNFAFARDTDAVAASIPESVEVAVRDGELTYVDAMRGRTLVVTGF